VGHHEARGRGELRGRRGRKIVALGASMSKFAIVTSRDSNIYAPEMLKNRDIAVTPNNGSHFTTLKMMEGFLAQEHVRTTNAGTMVKGSRRCATAASRR
jgi:ABC-type nitrate/sulfonate/bicarbonate transport system substrate-binding protein